MHRFWMLFDPRQVLTGVAVAVFTLAITIHFILLSTDRYNWLGDPDGGGLAVSAQQEAMPPARS
jgi:light-harvesting complex 1 alpha chain